MLGICLVGASRERANSAGLRAIFGALGVCAYSDWATSAHRREAMGRTRRRLLPVIGRAVGTDVRVGSGRAYAREALRRHHIGADKTPTMKRVSSPIDISSDEREQIRLDFYRAHRAQAGFSSVAVRRDPEPRAAWFLDVGATGPVDVPSSRSSFPGNRAGA